MNRRTRYWACPCCRVVITRRKGEKEARAASAMRIALSHELPRQTNLRTSYTADGIAQGTVLVAAVLKVNSNFKAERRFTQTLWRGTREQLVRWTMAPVCEQCGRCSMKAVHIYPVQRKRVCKHFK